MCGIAGFIGEAPDRRGVLAAMTGSLSHRGPDSDGMWLDTGIALGHRRLSILDLSEAGAQPMASRSGRYTVVFNGEIYNHLSLRAQLGGPWRGHGDTETLLAAIERWGLRESLPRFIGMFAFALWDAERRALVLVRDRLGIKPLYWGSFGSTTAFASELKAIVAHPGFIRRVDRNSLARYMGANCVPHPGSIWEGIEQVPPGTMLEVREGRVLRERYWEARHHAAAALDARFDGPPEVAIERLEEALLDAVQLRLLSDVPLGAFLSGGVDSSTVVAMMRRATASTIKTFSIGYERSDYDESAHARAVAAHLGTEHTELIVTAEDALDVVPMLASMYDEPFSDSSQIPTYLVSQLARKHVTVALSGDGGDELFGGYERHVWGPRLWATLRRVPRSARRVVAACLEVVPASAWAEVFDLVDRVAPGRLPVRLPVEKIQKLSRVLPAATLAELYAALTTHWDDGVVLGAAAGKSRWEAVGGAAESMMLMDLETYLPDDILVKVDRASMAVGLEARVPLLDHRVVELAWKMPLEYKHRGGQSKWLLRQVLYRHVPRALIDRPKMGFGVPIDEWLRGPLRPWAEELLSEHRLREEGYFDTKLIRRRWRQHLRRQHNWQFHLWDVLMFQAWLERWR